MATIYMTLLGPEGIKEAAEANAFNTRYAFKELLKIDGITLKFNNPFFNEFVIDLPKTPSQLRTKILKEDGIDIGLPLKKLYPDMENALLVCATETKTKEDIRKFVKESIEKIKQMDLETICFRKGLSKNPEDYDSIQDYGRAAIYSNKYLGTNFRKGSKVKYIYVKKTKGIPYTDVIAFEHVKQVEGKIEIDWDKVIEKSIYMPAEDILEDLGIYSIQRRGLTVKDIVERIRKKKNK